MNKNIVVTLIAGTFFAGSLVAPAFASDKLATSEITTQQAPTSVTDIQLPSRIPSLGELGDRLKNLDIGAILDRDDIREKLPIELPDLERLPDILNLPDAKPVELPKTVEMPEPVPVVLPKIEPVGVPETPVASAPVAEAEVEEATPARRPVKDIVGDTKAQKAEILAAHGGDRRAAKAELKAAQMRMVGEIKANNGARGKGKGRQ